MYNLDFETMKQVMQEHQRTGYLYSDVPSGVAGVPGPCRIEINIKAGTVVSCSIVGNGGQRVTGKDSVKHIARLGRLKWIFTPQAEITTASIPVTPVPEEVPLFPTRSVYLEQWQMQSWPRMHRTVFALADGSRSIVKIAEILSASPDVVEKTLRDLQSIGVITMNPSNGMNNQGGRNHL